jgi:hypothetical protein
MTEFHGWDSIRAELHDGDDAALAAERARTAAWISAFHLAEKRKRLEETTAILRDPGAMSRLAESDAELARGEIVSDEDLAAAMRQRKSSAK